MLGMTSIRAQTARLLLDRVSPDEQVALLRELASSLGSGSGKSDLSLTATLLQLRPDADATQSVFEHVDSLIEKAELDQIVAVCAEHGDLNDAVFSRTCAAVAEAAIVLQTASREYFVVPTSIPLSSGSTSNRVEEQQLPVVITRSTNRLRLVNRTSFRTHGSRHVHTLFRSCLAMLGAENRVLRTQAQETLALMLSNGSISSDEEQRHIWTRVRELINSPDKAFKAVGYSLWLRWISTVVVADTGILKSQEYWKFVMDGLREGDNERRKSCLQLLRASVDVAMREPDLVEAIVVSSARTESPATIQKHYARYCTVFETVVLGRYLNQVHECEADLDFLCSRSSAVKPVWVYTLLSCALDHKMQESNRKLIGSWALQADPRVDGTVEYLTFLEDALLPWATLGNLFTGTLRRHDGVIRCEHGDRLSAFVSGLLINNPDMSDATVDTILGSISGKFGNRFAQAKVYLIEGVARAVKQSSSIQLKDAHLEKIYEIAKWANLTEVARDYLFAQSWKMCYDQLQKKDVKSSEFLVASADKWKALEVYAEELEASASAGSIGSMALPPSNREKNEQKTYQRCQAFLAQIESSIGNPAELDAMQEELLDIWSDLEYLEYPKGLLASLPLVLLDRNLIRLVTQNKCHALCDIVAGKVQRLLELAQPRSYMLTGLMELIRTAVTQIPECAGPLRLSTMIVRVAQHPPSATIDVQLEEVLVPLIANISPHLGKFNYEFYFGQRESQGFATLLDMVSRLGAIDTSTPRQIFDELFQPWLTQKIPPNVVSQWKTILELQVMLLCCEQFLPSLASEETKGLLLDIQYVLSVEPLPRYRYMLEWLVARIYIHHPELRHVIFQELRTKDHHANPKFLASLMKIGVRIAKAKGADEEFALQLATLFVPLSASSKVVIRHEAQWQVPILLDHVRQMQIDAITNNTAFGALDEFIRSLEVYGDPPLERQIGVFDPIKDHNLTHLVEGAWHDLDEHEDRICSRSDFMALYAKGDVSDHSPLSCIPLGDPVPPRPAGRNEHDSLQASVDRERRMLQNIDNIARSLGAGPVSATALQTKGAAYLESARKRHDNLVVVASLVDNPYNLGGLSRVSEIFGAGGLYLENPRVTSNRDFTSTAVSSQYHLAINALASSDIQDFLAEKRREEGYSVVGIEQTDRSVMLGAEDCILPEKCILVMGSEREGIPALILAECDILVEIPQVGVTRSLNVQTAAGIVLCEYARQHNSKLK